MFPEITSHSPSWEHVGNTGSTASLPDAHQSLSRESLTVSLVTEGKDIEHEGNVTLIRMPLGANELLVSRVPLSRAVRVEEIGAPQLWAWSLSEDTEVWRNHPGADRVFWIVGGILRPPLAPGVDCVELVPEAGARVSARMCDGVWIAAIADGPAVAHCDVVWSLAGTEIDRMALTPPSLPEWLGDVWETGGWTSYAPLD